MISFRHKGDFSKFSNYLKKSKQAVRANILGRYAAEGVKALSSATPIDSGATASSWYYEIQEGSTSSIISFHNSNINKGVPIAIILQYGHGTGTGGWVQGRDYINPAIQPVFDKIANDVWKEVASI